MSRKGKLILGILLAVVIAVAGITTTILLTRQAAEKQPTIVRNEKEFRAAVTKDSDKPIVLKKDVNVEGDVEITSLNDISLNGKTLTVGGKLSVKSSAAGSMTMGDETGGKIIAQSIAVDAVKAHIDWSADVQLPSNATERNFAVKTAPDSFVFSGLFLKEDGTAKSEAYILAEAGNVVISVDASDVAEKIVYTLVVPSAAASVRAENSAKNVDVTVKTAASVQVAGNIAVKSDNADVEITADKNYSGQTKIEIVEGTVAAVDAGGAEVSVSQGASAGDVVADKVVNNGEITGNVSADEITGGGQVDESKVNAEAKEAAKAELASYKNQEDFTADIWQKIENEITKGNTAIDAALSVAEINAELAKAKSAIDAAASEQQLSAAKTAAKEELAAYVQQTNYSELGWAKVQEVIATANGKIDAATTAEKVAEELAAGKTAIDAIDTKAEEDAKELQKAKTAAKAALIGYVQQTNYSELGWAKVQEAIATANGKIDAATTAAKVAEELAAGKAAIDAIDTKAEEEAKALAAAKTAAKEALQTALSGYSESDYSAENWAKITTAKATGDTAIEAAATIEAVNTAKTTALNAMAAVETKAETELKRAKEAAKEALETAFDGYDSKDYSTEAFAAIEKAKTDGITAIDAAETAQEATTAKTTAINAMAAVKTLEFEWYTGEADVYTLTLPQQLTGLSKLANAEQNAIDFSGITIKLGADIDLSGRDWKPIKTFKGTFDGQNHEIKGIALSEQQEYYVFAYNDDMTRDKIAHGGFILNADGAVFKDIAFNVNIDTISEEDYADNFTGGVIGAMKGGSATNVTVKGTVADYFRVGGFVGAVYGTENVTFTKVINEAAVTSTYGTLTTTNKSNAGGIIGRSIAEVTLENCENKGAVTGDNMAGGLISSVQSAVAVTGGVNGAAVEAKQANGYGGGLFAWTQAAVVLTDVSNTGDVTAATFAGGIIGYAVGEVTVTGSSANSGKVTGTGANTNIGGFAGRIRQGSVTGFVNSGSVEAQNYKTAGGILGTVAETPDGATVTIDNCKGAANDAVLSEGAGSLVGTTGVAAAKLILAGAVSEGSYSAVSDITHNCGFTLKNSTVDTVTVSTNAAGTAFIVLDNAEIAKLVKTNGTGKLTVSGTGTIKETEGGNIVNTAWLREAGTPSVITTAADWAGLKSLIASETLTKGITIQLGADFEDAAWDLVLPAVSLDMNGCKLTVKTFKIEDDSFAGEVKLSDSKPGAYVTANNAVNGSFARLAADTVTVNLPQGKIVFDGILIKVGKQDQALIINASEAFVRNNAAGVYDTTSLTRWVLKTGSTLTFEGEYATDDISLYRVVHPETGTKVIDGRTFPGRNKDNVSTRIVSSYDQIMLWVASTEKAVEAEYATADASAYKLIKANNNGINIKDVTDESVKNGYAALLGFDGGYGTEENPWEIANVDQWLYMANGWAGNEQPYFVLTADIDFRGKSDTLNTINGFRGHLDGQGFNVYVNQATFAKSVDMSLLCGSQSQPFEKVNALFGGTANTTNPASVSDLIFNAEGTGSLFLWINNKNFTFSGVTAKGTAVYERNESPFASIFSGSGSLTFTDCVNFADITCRESENGEDKPYWSGIFLGGYRYGTVGITLNFTNCLNYGSLYGNNAAMLIGNSNLMRTNDKINVTGCVNYGVIRGLEEANTAVNYVGGNAEVKDKIDALNAAVANGTTTYKGKEYVGRTYSASEIWEVSSPEELAEMLEKGTKKIVFGGDISADVTIPENRTLTLDLNGFALGGAIVNNGTLTVTGKGTVAAQIGHAVTNNGTLVIENGIFTAAEADSAVLYNNGTLTVKGGEFRFADGAASQYYVVYNAEGAYLTVTNGKFANSGSGASLIDNHGEITSISGGTFTNGTCVIKNEPTGVIKSVSGGTFTMIAEDTDRAVVLNYGEITEISGSARFVLQSETKTSNSVIYSYGTVNIAGGEFISQTQVMHNVVYAYSGTVDNVEYIGKVTISGGTFFSQGNTSYVLYTARSGKNTVPVISVSGGDFTGKVGSYGSSVYKPLITGGTFTVSPAGYTEEGYGLLYKEGKYLVLSEDKFTYQDSASEGYYEATIDAVYYASADSAVAEAGPKKTVTLYASSGIDKVLTAYDSYTLTFVFKNEAQYTGDVTTTDDKFEVVKTDNEDGSVTYAAVVKSEYAAASVLRGSTVLYYTTLQNAVLYAADGDVVTLLKDQEKDTSYTVSKNITLDLNGFGVTVQSGGAYGAISISGKKIVTIKDSVGTGKIIYAADKNYAVYAKSGAEVTIEGGTFEAYDRVIYSYGLNTVVTINGGTFTARKDGGTAFWVDQNGVLNLNAFESADKIAANAETGVAVVKTADMLKWAFDNAAANVNIALGTSIASDVTVKEGCTVIFDLNGYTLTGTVTNKGTLTITGEGKVQSSTDHTVKNYGTLTIQNGTFDALMNGKAALYNEANASATVVTGTFVRSNEGGTRLNGVNDTHGNSYYYIENHGAMTIEYAVVEGLSASSSTIRNGYEPKDIPTDITEPSKAELTVKDGIFSSYWITVKNDDNGKLFIEGGKFSVVKDLTKNDNAGSDVLLNWAYAEISGGELINQRNIKNDQVILSSAYMNGGVNENSLTVSGSAKITADIDGIAVRAFSYDGTAMPVLNITGGTVTGQVLTEYAEVTITNGSFSSKNVTALLGIKGSVITIEGGTFAFTRESGKGTNLIELQGESVLTVTGGHFETEGYGFAVLYGSTLKYGGTAETEALWTAVSGKNTNPSMHVEIIGGTMTTVEDAVIYMPAEGTLTITGGTFTGPSIMDVRMGAAEIAIDGNVTFTATKEQWTALTLAQTGGATKSDGSAIILNTNRYTSENPSLNLTIGDSVEITAASGRIITVYDWNQYEQVCTFDFGKYAEQAVYYDYSDGELARVIRASDADELIAMSQTVNSQLSVRWHLYLDDSIDMQGRTWTPIGQLTYDCNESSNQGITATASFNGIFDGNGYTVSNLTFDGQGTANGGLFGSIANSVVRNVVLQDAAISDAPFSAAVVGAAFATGGNTTLIKDVSVINAVVGGSRQIGAVAGYVNANTAHAGSNVTLTNCKVDGATLTASPERLNAGSYDNGDKVGGITGYAQGTLNIGGCSVTDLTITAYRDAGGLVGAMTASADAVTTSSVNNFTVTIDQITNSYGQKEYNVNAAVGRMLGGGTPDCTVNGYELIMNVTEEAQLALVEQALTSGGGVLTDATINVKESFSLTSHVNLYSSGIKNGLVIDLGGNTVFSDTAVRLFVVRNGKTTIKNGSLNAIGSGTSNADGAGCYGALQICETAVVYLDDLTLTNARPFGLNILIKTGAEAYLNNVIINSTIGGAMEIGGKAELRNCTFTQTGYYDFCSTAVGVSGNGTADIYSGTYTAAFALYVFSSGGTINVHGGDFISNDSQKGNVLRTDWDKETYPSGEINVAVKGGTFDGTVKLDASTNFTTSTAAGLNLLAQGSAAITDTYTGNITLAGNIELDSAELPVIAKKGFSGTFDGKGFTISDLVINDQSKTEYTGIIGRLVSPGVIKNVNVDGAVVTGHSGVGVIAGGYTGTITNCHVTGLIQVEGHYKVGGIIGDAYTTVTDCSVIGTSGSYVRGVYYADEANREGDNVGGIIGFTGERNNAAVFSGLRAEIDVQGTRKVGGIMGYMHNNVQITGAYYSGNVTCNASADYLADNVGKIYIGGIAGEYTVNNVIASCTVENAVITGAEADTTKVIVGGRRATVTGTDIVLENNTETNAQTAILS